MNIKYKVMNMDKKIFRGVGLAFAVAVTVLMVGCRSGKVVAKTEPEPERKVIPIDSAEYLAEGAFMVDTIEVKRAVILRGKHGGGYFIMPREILKKFPYGVTEGDLLSRPDVSVFALNLGDSLAVCLGKHQAAQLKGLGEYDRLVGGGPEPTRWQVYPYLKNFDYVVSDLTVRKMTKYILFMVRGYAYNYGSHGCQGRENAGCVAFPVPWAYYRMCIPFR